MAHEGVSKGEGADPGRLHLGETAEERNARLATYVVVGGAVLVAAIAGAAVTVRDRNRRQGRPGGV